MRLSAKVIKNYSDINHFDFGNQWEIRAGEPNSLYFQLVDLDQAGLRYIPQGASPAINVTFPSIDDSKVLTIAASQVSGDGSLWKIDLNASQIPASGNVVFAITEGGVTRKFSGLNFISVEYPGQDGSC